VIVGGGVATLEGLMALRHLMNGFVAINVVAPSPEFVYRPLSVAAPFGIAEPRHFALGQIAADHGASLHQARVRVVEPRRGIATLTNGGVLEYDALLLAPGARPRDWLPGAIHFTGSDAVGQVRAVVDRLAAGTASDVVFTAPAAATWTLPLYELALLTAAHVGELVRGELRLTIATPEPEPLELFGPSASDHIRDLCATRGIEVRTSARPLSLEDGQLVLDGRESITADDVVALPELRGEAINGIPHDEQGFIPVDRHGAVIGLERVYAAGDGIAYPVKQGGLAAQQADVAAEAIAAKFGVAIEPQPFRPRLRGQLLTGLGPTYLTAGPDARHPDALAEVSASPLWWPPSKIAGRFLAPYLAGQVSSGERRELAERNRAAPRAPAADAELSRLAVGLAESDAARGDHESAVLWLDTIEQIEGVLPPALEEKRTAWRRRIA
jgi:sulfide:quinone oxidoreductase